MDKKIGFIGAGNMGGALITAACRSVSPDEVVITDHLQDKAQALADDLGCVCVKSNCEVADGCEFVVLAVKPHLIEGVVKEIAPCIRDASSKGQRRIIVTIAAGVTAAKVRNALGLPDIPVIRLMPNMPAMTGDGMILITSDAQDPANVSDEVFAEFQDILKEAGAFEKIPEGLVDAATSVSSCSPAFVFMFIEAMADAGVALGIPRDQAMRLASKAVEGSAAMVYKTGKHPGALKDAVCSPGGSTIVGVKALEECGMRNAVIQAVERSAQKNMSLGK